MCGMDWYRQQMEIAENDIERLQQLLRMMEERYQLLQVETNALKNQANPAIIAIYQEIVFRKNSLLMRNSPQV